MRESRRKHVILGQLILAGCVVLAPLAHARHYDPKNGRFLQRDPAEDDEANPYTYVGNNPTNYVDPLGLFAIGLDGTVRDRGPHVWSPQPAFPPIEPQPPGLVPPSEWQPPDVTPSGPDLLPQPPGTGSGPGSEGKKSGTLPGMHQPGRGIETSGELTERDGDQRKANDKKLSPQEIKKLQKAGIDPEELKGGKRTGRWNLYKDSRGNVYIRPQGGQGPGEPTGININSL